MPPTGPTVLPTIQIYAKWLVHGDVALIPDLPGQPGGWVEIVDSNARGRRSNPPDPVALDVFRLVATAGPDGVVHIVSPPGPDVYARLFLPPGTPVQRLYPEET